MRAWAAAQPAVSFVRQLCPVTPAQLLSPTLPMTLRDGSLYVTGLGSQSVLRVSGNGSAYTGRVGWLAPSDFSAQALVRGKRIDGTGAVSFNNANPSSVDPTGAAVEIDTADEAAPPDGVMYDWNSDVQVAAPDCYAFQVDSEASSQVIVFSAELASQ